MRRFLKRLGLFLAGFAAILLVGLLLPPTPRASSSYLYSYPAKLERFRSLPPPRLILLGGSNLSFGIDSRILKEHLGYHVVNMGISVHLGLYFMLDSALPRIQAGDLVVAAPEYEFYVNDFIHGDEELLRLVLHVAPGDARFVRPDSWFQLLKYVPRVALSKFKPMEYLGWSKKFGYSRESFNEYGDIDVHWDEPQQAFSPHGAFENLLNPAVIRELKEFSDKVVAKGARFMVTFPSFQEESLAANHQMLNQLVDLLRAGGIEIVGTPERYAIPFELLYDTSYHPRGEGAARRTTRLAEDLASHLENQGS
ncbi:MAG: hypothetical protein ACP5I4_04425 [Oceanipulchritudo sp.]